MRQDDSARQAELTWKRQKRPTSIDADGKLRDHRPQERTVFVFACLLGAVLGLSGCRKSPLDEPFLKSKPVAGEFVGVWRLEATTRGFLSAKGYVLTKNQLVLKQDGTYTLTNMPNYADESRGSRRSFHSRAGSWKLAPNISGWAVELAPDPSQGAHGEGIMVLGVRRAKPPYLLYSPVEDPDLDEAIFFERTSEDPNTEGTRGHP